MVEGQLDIGLQEAFAAAAVVAPAFVAVGEDLLPPQKRGDALPHSGVCRLEQVSRMFFLDRDYRPGKNLLQMQKPVSIPTGQAHLLKP